MWNVCIWWWAGFCLVFYYTMMANNPLLVFDARRRTRTDAQAKPSMKNHRLSTWHRHLPTTIPTKTSVIVRRQEADRLYQVSYRDILCIQEKQTSLISLWPVVHEHIRTWYTKEKNSISNSIKWVGVPWKGGYPLSWCQSYSSSVYDVSTGFHVFHFC